MTSHYNAEYFEWQKTSGEFCGVANQIKFRDFASERLNLLEFGCGGGYMLRNLPAKAKLGIEINGAARSEAQSHGLTVYENAKEVPDSWADLLISDNALEHTPHPLEELKRLSNKVKSGGLAVFVVPCEHLDMAYEDDDINQHLYSWSPLSIGNLFKQAGFQIVSSKPFYHKHPPYSWRLRPLVGAKTFDLICKINGLVNKRRWNEVRVVAKKP